MQISTYVKFTKYLQIFLRRFKQMTTFTQLLGHSFGKNSSHYISQKTTLNDRQIQIFLIAQYFTRTQKLNIGNKVFTININVDIQFSEY